jgi:phosphomannomutase/phosphoglucomutase
VYRGHRVAKATAWHALLLWIDVGIREQLRGGQQRVEFDVVVGQRLAGPLLAIDDDEGPPDDGASLAQRLDGVGGALSRGRDVLQHDDLLALVQVPLDAVARAVLLGRLPDDDVGEAGFDARRGDQRHCPECHAREFYSADALGEGRRDCRQCVGVGLEAVLIDVVVARAAMGEFELPELDGVGRPERVDEGLRVHVSGVAAVAKGLADPSRAPAERNPYHGGEHRPTRMHVFGSSGVRGVANEKLTPAFALEVAQAAGAAFGASRVALARDTRHTGGMLTDAVASGLASLGADVDRLGVVPTPGLQAYCAREGVPGVMVTASHNPPPYNGIKLIGAEGVELTRARLDDVEDRLSAGPALVGWDAVGEARQIDSARRYYRDQLLESVDREQVAAATLTVALDPGHGAGSLTSPQLFRELGCSVLTVNAQPDGRFPGRNPEPVEETLGDLRRLVRTADADLGVAHDGDADRAIFVDETGTFVEGDAALAALAAAEVGRDDALVSAVNASQRLVDVAEAAGADLRLTPIGSTHIITAIRELQAEGRHVPVAGEGNGGILFPDYRIARDGAYTAARFCELIADRPASEVVAEYDGYHNVRHNVAFADEGERAAMLAAIEAQAERADAKVDTTDGYRLDYGDAWVLARPSGTEPVVRVYAEARARDRARDLADEMVAAIERA